MAWTSVLLVASLVMVISCREEVVESAMARCGPCRRSCRRIRLIVALLVLLPESMAAVRAAYRDELQKSLNLALGSSSQHRADDPAVAAVAVCLHRDLVLGLEPKKHCSRPHDDRERC